jgi:hypothetical protein
LQTLHEFGTDAVSNQEGKIMVDVSNETNRTADETAELVDATGQKFSQAAQRGASDAIDRSEATTQRWNEATQRGASDTIARAEATGRRLNQTAEGMFNDTLRFYQTLFSFQGARRLAETWIEVNEQLAKESVDFNLRFIGLWFDGARKLWQAADEGRKQMTVTA